MFLGTVIPLGKDLSFPVSPHPFYKDTASFADDQPPLGFTKAIQKS